MDLRNDSTSQTRVIWCYRVLSSAAAKNVAAYKTKSQQRLRVIEKSWKAAASYLNLNQNKDLTTIKQ